VDRSTGSGHVAEGTAAELKARVGGARLVVRLPVAHPGAAAALEPLAAGAVRRSDDGRVLQAPVDARDGLATAVLRALDAAGAAVDDIEVHRPSLDDVFFALTGHAAAPEAELQEV